MPMSDDPTAKPKVKRATKRKKCPSCGKLFTYAASREGKRKYCSPQCRSDDTKAGRERRRQAEAEAAAIAAITKVKTKSTRLTPTESAEIRGKISSYMNEQIAQAALVVAGAVEWSPVQARVFSTLLNKVVPDLNASYIQQETTPTDLSQMTREQLEQLAQHMNQAMAIDGTPKELSGHTDDIQQSIVSELHEKESDRRDHKP